MNQQSENQEEGFEDNFVIIENNSEELELELTEDYAGPAGQAPLHFIEIMSENIVPNMNEQSENQEQCCEDDFVIIENNVNNSEEKELELIEDEEETYSEDETIDTLTNYFFDVVNFGREKTVKRKDISIEAFNDLKKISRPWKQKKYWGGCRSVRVNPHISNDFSELLVENLVNVTGVFKSDNNKIVFHAVPKRSFSDKLPKECLLKIYRMSLVDLKQWKKFIPDIHYSRDKNKQLSKEAIRKYTEKEKDILIKLELAEVNAPRVIAVKNDILVTTFIGDNKKQAPFLKDANLTKAEFKEAFNQIIEAMEKMYRSNLIHGDLSENSILWYDQTCYIISVANCVKKTDINAFNILFKNCTNISRFFSKKIQPVPCSAKLLFYKIVGCSFDNKTFLHEEYCKEEYKNIKLGQIKYLKY